MSDPIDFNIIFDEIAKQIRAADESNNMLAWRDAWMFLQGVNLVMKQVDSDLSKDFEELADGLRKEQNKLLQIPMPLSGGEVPKKPRKSKAKTNGAG